MSAQRLERPSVWQQGNLTLINGDFLEVGLPDDSIDLVVTSPPFNLGKNYGPFYNDELDYPDYLHQMSGWLRETFKVIKDDGRVCWNVPFDTSRGGVHHPVSFDIFNIAREVGFKYHPSIIWNESNTSKRTAVGSVKSASAPYGAAPVEVIFVLYKNQWKKINKGSSDITIGEQFDWSWQTWGVNGENRGKVRGNPAAWPLEIPYRCIKRYTYIDDLVLDPFVGSGTTLTACQRLGRRGIGVEINSIEPAIRNIIRDCNLDPSGWVQTDSLVLPLS